MANHDRKNCLWDQHQSQEPPMFVAPARLPRRTFLGGSTALLSLRGSNLFAALEDVSIRAITRKPAFHWFAYYDKFQFDPTERYALGMEVSFEHRSPTPQDAVEIGMIDLQDGDRWIPLGKTTAWCWQQGCMLQWRPGAVSEIVYNDREEGRYVCRIQNVITGAKRTIPWPIYALAPDGRVAVTADFRRINDLRPGYGYVGFPDPFAQEPAPDKAGIWRVDLDSGKSELIVVIAQAVAIPWPQGFGDAIHWFNHLLVNPAGTRFVFLHRWKLANAKGWLTRMFSAGLDGSDLRVLIGSGYVSHFIWRDESHVLAYSKPHPEASWGFYLYEDVPNGRVEQVGAGVMGPGDGHCNYLPGNEWIVCDTYPDKNRLQHVYLYHVPSSRRIELAAFLSPPQYTGEWRCDTHPRVSRTGKFVTVDSPHDGGRQIYLIDISKIVG
ncbi:MAG: hypothetical protein ACUVQG_07435 [Thermogutta sp.]